MIEPYISRADTNHQLIGGISTGTGVATGVGIGSPSKHSSRGAAGLPMSGGGVEGVVVVEPSYVEKTALSLVMFLREGNYMT